MFCIRGIGGIRGFRDIGGKSGVSGTGSSKRRGKGAGIFDKCGIARIRGKGGSTCGMDGDIGGSTGCENSGAVGSSAA